MSAQKTKVAVIQMTSTPDVEANLQAVERLVGEAAEDRARLLLVPEAFAYLGPEEGQRDVAEALPGGGPILQRMQSLAREWSVELVLGGFWEKTSGDKVRNACVHLDDDGEVRAVYRKIHLFDVDLADGTKLEESAKVEPGTEIVVAQTRFGGLGLSVCYDVRFPELYRRLVDAGATSLAIPAAFTLHTGKDHWHVLLRARAIEQQSWVLAAAQVGHHYGRRHSYGHAVIIDPWGNVRADAGGEGEGFATAFVDPEEVSRIRRQLPSLANRRLQ
jgi:predicted amidohydrolase